MKQALIALPQSWREVALKLQIGGGTLNNLCFSTFAVEIKGALNEATANEDVTELLFNSVVFPVSLMNKKSDPFTVSKETASRLFNRLINVPQEIRRTSVSPEVAASIYNYFGKNVLSRLMPGLEQDLLLKLTTIIHADDSIPDSTKNDFISKAQKNTLAEFLADVFLYTLKKPNKQSVVDASIEARDELALALSDADKLQALLGKLNLTLPSALIPPGEVESHEMVYVTELLAAYADAAGIAELPKESLSQHPRYKNDFERRRKDYYAAETIRRGSRDIFRETDPAQFDILKCETYDGVIDEHSQNFPHGYARLNSVMTQAALLSIEKCLLSRLPNWIGNSEKKGVCHILVNDGRLKWVTSDE